jgi:hypothetical protein
MQRSSARKILNDGNRCTGINPRHVCQAGQPGWHATALDPLRDNRVAADAINRTSRVPGDRLGIQSAPAEIAECEH